MALTQMTTATNNIQSLANRVTGQASANKLAFDQFGIDCKTYINDTLTAEIDTLDSANCKLTGNQTVAGIKTFSSSPIVPTPTTDMQACTKKYAEDFANSLPPLGTGSVLNVHLGTDIKVGSLASLTTTEKASVVGAINEVEATAEGAIPKSIVDAAGDLIVGSAADTVTRKAIGTAFQYLRVNSGATDLEWATNLNVKTGLFSRDISTATGTQAITGIGFTPKVVIAFSAITGAVGNMSMGFFDTTSRSISDEYQGTPDTYSGRNYGVFMYLSTGQYGGTLSSFDADGFTISWTKFGSPTGTASIYYIALG